MKYVVYCDESRHNGAENHRYMAIGGLWVPEPSKFATSRAFRDLCRSLNLRAEIKWSKVSQSRLNDYKRLADFFFDNEDLHYRVIIVDQSKVDLARFHGGDAELCFYRLYYQMLKPWICQRNHYLILVDFKQNRMPTRYRELRSKLEQRAAVARALISDLTVIDSSRTPLAQLCDLITGAVAASFCVDTRSAKTDLAAHIAMRAGLPHLKVRHASPAFTKFNIFRIELQK